MKLLKPAFLNKFSFNKGFLNKVVLIFKRKILAKILLIFLSIHLISFITIAVYQSMQSKKLIEQFSQQMEFLLVTQIEKSGELLFEITEKSLLSLSREKSVTDILVDEKYEEQLIKDFRSYVEINGSIKALLMRTYNDEFYRYPVNSVKAKAYKPTEEIWYREAMENRGRVIYTSPFYDEVTGETVIAIAKTVNKDGNVIGVVGAMLSIDLFQHILQDIQVGESGYALAVDKNGIIIAHRNSEMVGQSVIDSTFYKAMHQNKHGFFYYDNEGSQQFMKFATNERTGWKFAVTMGYYEIQRQIWTSIGKNIIILIIALVIGGVLSIWVVRSIISPISQLAKSMKDVEKGNLSVSLDVSLQDETGQLIRGFNQMIIKIKTLVEEISKACRMILNSSTEFGHICEKNLSKAQQINMSIQSISEGAENQAQQAESIFNMMEEFSTCIKSVIDNICRINDETSNSAQISEEGIRIVEELHEASKMNAEHVEEVMEEIHGLHEKSHAVMTIIDYIEKIAKQTNLISLNASIEAARSGEHGRGFTVVANEVHNLAEETQKLAKNIHNVLNEMLIQVDKTTKLIKVTKETSYSEYDSMLKTKNIFTRIDTATSKIYHEMETLNQSVILMREQNEGILSAVKDIAVVTEESAISSKQIYQSVDEQTNNTERLFQESSQLIETAKLLQEKIHKSPPLAWTIGKN
ncbi:methyl-accepting chemotaxis protein [Proteiniborus sp.]|uniref:methyl-accepting chemotaxis protein n=1 Tax=Proteiniborus sp. TaxID=2079015 RepID=UPI0033230BAC